MQTLAQEHQNSASYWGEYPDWLVAYARHRDSDTLTNCNFQVFRDELDRIDPDGDSWTIEPSGHWAVGWVEYIAVEPDSPALDLAKKLIAQLEDYPVLCDETLTEMEYDQVEYYWGDLNLRDRIFELARQGESIFAARASMWELNDRAPRTLDHLVIECNR